MHVLMTTDTLGGVFTYSLQLASWLNAKGVQVTLASMGKAVTAEQRSLVRRAGATLVESSYRLEWMNDPWDEVAQAEEWLLEIEQRVRPDVVHVNGYTHGAARWTAPVVVVAHSCVLSWWRAVLNEAAAPHYACYRENVSRGLSAAQAIVAPTRAMLESLQREYGELPHGHVIYNGARLAPAAPPEKEPFVLSAGRLWDPAKNIGLEQAALLIKWPIFVAGAPTGPNAQSGPASSRVRTLGLLSGDDLGTWMRRAAIYALPALYEPFGLSILEAASAKCALVLGDTPSLRELWGGCASFVSQRDPAALAEALTELISAPALRANLADHARRRASEYSADRMGTAYLALYERLSEGRSARAQVPRFHGVEACGAPTSLDPRQ